MKISVRTLKQDGFDYMKSSNGDLLPSLTVKKLIQFEISEVMEDYDEDVMFYSLNGQLDTLPGVVGESLYILNNVNVSYPGNNTILTTTDDGIKFSYQSKDGELGCNAILIHGDMLKNSTNINQLLISLREYVKAYVIPRIEANSWSKTKDKNGMIDKIVELLERDREVSRRQFENRLIQQQERINIQKDRLASAYKDMNGIMDNYRRNNMSTIDNKGKIIEDLTLITELDKIKDVEVIDDVIQILTKEIIIHSGDDKYYGGEYTISLQLEDNNINILGKTFNDGFWSKEDSHPHVNGRNGVACFGNLHSTIIELMSQRELYAVTLSLIDFLESVNTSDPAGERINKWKKID